MYCREQSKYKSVPLPKGWLQFIWGYNNINAQIVLLYDAKSYHVIWTVVLNWVLYVVYFKNTDAKTILALPK